MTTIDVPDIPRPRRTLCWKQKLNPPGAMSRCDRVNGHGGMHSWELYARIHELEGAIVQSITAEDLSGIMKES